MIKRILYLASVLLWTAFLLGQSSGGNKGSSSGAGLPSGCSAVVVGGNNAIKCPGGFLAGNGSASNSSAANGQLVKESGGNLVLATTSDTNVPVYPVLFGGSSAAIYIATSGQVSVLFDSGGDTDGHYIGESTLTSGSATDLGATCPAGKFIIGQAVGTNSGTGTWVVQLNPQFCPGSSTAPGADKDVLLNKATVPGVDTGNFVFDYTNHRLGVLASASPDAPIKVGTNAVNGAGGIGLTSSGIATGMTVNDTNFPNVRYPFAFVDGNNCSVTNGGANNAICGTIMAAETISSSNVAEYEGFGYQGIVNAAVTVATMIGFDSAITNNGTIGAITAFDCFDVSGGTVTGHNTCFLDNSQTYHGTHFFIEQASLNGVSYFNGKIGVGAVTIPVDVLEVDSGNLRFNGGKGQHLNTQAANNDISGTCTASAATTCTVTFTTAYTSAPSCVAVDATNITTLKVTPSTASLIITTTGATSDVFDYHCHGNPN